jgi:hypothetical protein
MDEVSDESGSIINPSDNEIVNKEAVSNATDPTPTIVFGKKPLNDKEPGESEVPQVFRDAFKDEGKD